jgi:tRNA(Arg) A34 adenosine deaminase TadA
MPVAGLSREDEFHLRRSIELAAEARAAGRHPFGSLIVNGTARLISPVRYSVCVRTQ